MKELGGSWQNPDNEERAAKIITQDISIGNANLSLADDIATLWADTGLKAMVKRDGEYHLLDSGPYFLDRFSH